MDEFDQNWRAVHVMWSETIVVGVAFLVNRFVLMPRLFFTKRYIHFAAAITALFLLLALFLFRFDGVNRIVPLFGDEAVVEESFRPTMMDAPPIHRNIPPHAMPPMSTPPLTSVFPPMLMVLILTAIVIALDMGLSISVKWIIAEQKQSHSDKERVAAQLANLQSQVSPHFFMNTLNNIHALVDIDSERAKQTIIELSGLMDYLLYESSNSGTVAVQRELDFVTSYVNLMRLRFPKQVRINLSHNGELPAAKIPPLLFLNFIENAFKYGVDFDEVSFINIHFDFNQRAINMNVTNSNHSANVTRMRHGLGISNTRKRLDLIYGDSYSLEIDDLDKIYFVNLKIPLQQ